MKTLLKQLLGIFLTISICILLFVATGAFLYWKYIKVSVPKQSVLHIALNDELLETGRNRERDLLSLVSAIDCARADPKIKGVYLEADASWNAGWASLEEIRSALKRFKAAGKFIVAYGNHYSQRAYYLTSCADETILHPAGVFMLVGLNFTLTHYRDLLDKLGIEADVLRIGRYKSAAEAYTKNHASAECRYQYTVLAHNLYDRFLKQTAAAKGLKASQIRAWAQTLTAILPQQALDRKLFSQLGYPVDAKDNIRKRLDMAEDAKLPLIPVQRYAYSTVQSKASKKDSIAIVTMCGAIDDKLVDTIVAQLRKARKCPEVKAIVLRINSPGGSALASQTLWHEITLTKAQKPVIASLGDVAASGGYYAAVACDKIVAQPNTITGSIGIFGLFFYTDKLLANKLGITKSVIKTAPSGDLFSRKMYPQERSVWRKILQSGYDGFLERVSKGRKLTRSQVSALAQGRVWSGELAHKKGLVDALGGLHTAVTAAARTAQLECPYKVSIWPTQLKSMWRRFDRYVQSSPLSHWKVLAHSNELVRDVAAMQGIQARMPYDLTVA